MPKTSPLQPLAPWVSLQSTDSDWDGLDPRVLDTMLAQLHLIRTFEEEVLGLAGQKLINGPAHASIGQEAGAVHAAEDVVVRQGGVQDGAADESRAQLPDDRLDFGQFGHRPET